MNKILPLMRPLMLGVFLLSLTLAPALARDGSQDPPGPFIYLLGKEATRDLESFSKLHISDNLPDTWFRMSLRNLGFYVGKRRNGGYYVQHFILRTKGGPHRQWDTIPDNNHPMLAVYRDGRKINDSRGSIAGYNPPGYGVIDLYIADDGTIAARHTPMEFEIKTLDGVLKLDVQLYNIWDTKVD